MRAYLSRRIQAIPVHAHTSLCMYDHICIYDDAYMYAYVCKCVTQICTH